MTTSTNTFSLTRREDGIALLTMDVPGESMNTLKAEFVPQMTELLAEIRNDSSIKGLVVISGKKDSFVAGADISMLDACDTSEKASELSAAGHKVFGGRRTGCLGVVCHGACFGLAGSMDKKFAFARSLAKCLLYGHFRNPFCPAVQ